MADITAQILGASNKLSTDHFQDWKETCVNKSLQYDAYDILNGSETELKLPARATSDDHKAIRDFRSHRSKMAGYLHDTLDAGQCTIIANIEPTNARAIWIAILGRYESKDTNSRLFATQQLLSLHMSNSGHESENFSEYGA